MSSSKLLRTFFFVFLGMLILAGVPRSRAAGTMSAQNRGLERYMGLLSYLSSEPPFPSIESLSRSSRAEKLKLSKLDPKALPEPYRKRALFLKAWMGSPDVPLTRDGLDPALSAYPDLAPVLLWHIANSRGLSAAQRTTLLRMEASRENAVFSPLSRGSAGDGRSRALLKKALASSGDRRQELFGRLVAFHPLSPESAVALEGLRPAVPGGDVLVPRWTTLQSMGANDLVLRETEAYLASSPPFPYRDRASYLGARALVMQGDSVKALTLIDGTLLEAPRLAVRSEIESLRCRIKISRDLETGVACLHSLFNEYPDFSALPGMVVMSLRQDIVSPLPHIPATLDLPRSLWKSRDGQDAAWLYGLDLALRGDRKGALAHWKNLSSVLRDISPERTSLLARTRYFRARLLEKLGHPARARTLYRKAIDGGDGSPYPLWSAIACRGECGAFHLPPHHPTRLERPPFRIRKAMEELSQMGLFGPALVIDRFSRHPGIDPEQILRYGDLDMAVSQRKRLLMVDQIFPAHGTGMRLPTGEWMTASILSGFYRSGVSPLWALSIARQESRFRERSLSVDGALGVMQLMPKTALAVVAGEGGDLAPGLVKNLGQVRYPEINSLIGGLYLKRLISAVPGHPERAIAGYNAGLHAVLSWRPLSKTDWDFFTESIPYQETRRYVREVLWNYAYLERHLKGVRNGTP